MAKGRLGGGLENILKHIKKSVLTTVAAVALPFMFNVDAGASPGNIVVDYKIGSPYNSNYCAIVHRPEYLGLALEGLDSYDTVWDLVPPPPSDIVSKIVSVVDEKEIRIDQRPVNSQTSIDLPYTVISQSGGAIPEISNPYLNISTTGLDDENVWITIEGKTYNAKTVGNVQLKSGITGTATVSFTRILPPVTDPTVQTLDVDEITKESGRAQGFLVSDGNDSGTEICAGRFGYHVAGGDNENVLYTDWITDIKEGESFSSVLSGLDPNTFYSVNTEVVVTNNEARKGYGDEKYFKTLENIIDSNIPPTPYPNEKRAAVIQYSILGQNPAFAQGTWTIAESNDPNVSFSLDGKDVFAIPYTGTGSSITSLLMIATGNPNKPYEFVELSKQVNPTTTTSDPNYPGTLNEMKIKGNKDIYRRTIKAWINGDSDKIDPNALENSFGGKDIVFEMVNADPNDTNTYPRMSMKNAIKNNGRTIDLGYVAFSDSDPNVFTTMDANIPYIITARDEALYGQFMTTTDPNKAIIDLNKDGKVDPNDYIMLNNEIGKSSGRFSSSDIAKPGKGNRFYALGPDFKTDIHDKRAFVEIYNKVNPDNPITTPKNVEDFETGDFNRFDWHDLYGNWNVVPDNDANHPGAYCAEAVVSTSGGNSMLETTFNSIGGNLNFDLNMKSDNDRLYAYIDGVEKQQWNGNQPWQSASIYVGPGEHTLRLFYKQRSTVSPDEKARIDNVVFPIAQN